MNENLKALMAAAAEDEALKAEMAAILAELDTEEEDARAAAVAKAVAAAQAHGFALTEADLVWEAPVEGEVTDEELMAVTGGGCKLCDAFYAFCPHYTTSG